MVKDPLNFLSHIHNPRLKKVLYHVETDVDHHCLINYINGRGLSAGIAIKLETKIEEFKDLVKYIDTLLFLAVDPCCYGNPFNPEVMEKIAEARELFPEIDIAVDGGVSPDNLKSFIDLA